MTLCCAAFVAALLVLLLRHARPLVTPHSGRTMGRRLLLVSSETGDFEDLVDDDINARQEDRWATTKYQTTYSQQPSFFPRTIDELALDARDSTQIALISSIKRIRVDIRMRITEKDRQMLRFLIRYVYMLLDDEIKTIKVLVGDDLVDRARMLWRELTDELQPPSLSSSSSSSSSPSSTTAAVAVAPSSSSSSLVSSDRILFLPMRQWPGEADLYVVHQPDQHAHGPEEVFYERLQTLCAHAAEARVSTIFVNPANMARAYTPSSLDSPILVNDFANAYFVCDDYFMISAGDKYMGLVQRAGLGTDLYLLEGFRHLSPKRYRRLDTYTRQPLPMDNVRDRITRVLIDDPDSPVVKVFKEANRRVSDADGFVDQQRRSGSVESSNIASFIKAFQGRQ